jgi:NAD(P)-dependent dehydrogenase (short-subunit alcohol dehydrogenase family)
VSTVLITGGHSGIGLECSKKLASTYRMNLILAGRSPVAIEAVAKELRSTSNVRVTSLELDTSSLVSVRAAAASVERMRSAGEVDSLQALICNAGVRLNQYAHSADGYEATFATNYLGHFLLVELLLNALSDHGRIVSTTSGTHDPDTMDGKLAGVPAEPDAHTLAYAGNDGTKPLSTGQLYTTSKLCMMLHAYELDRRLRRSGSAIESIAFDPGSTMGTGFLRNMPAPVQWLASRRFMKWVMRRVGVTIGTVDFSGASLARIAADPTFAKKSGKYFQSNGGKLIERPSSKMSYDEQRARKLWEDTRALVRLQPSEEPLQLR